MNSYTLITPAYAHGGEEEESAGDFSGIIGPALAIIIIVIAIVAVKIIKKITK